MCGIVGYIGERNAKDVLINGLTKLEYRGYDSAGMALFGDREINIYKKKGRLLSLVDSLNGIELKGNIGMGHTRWATHGAPSDENSHPHKGMNGVITVVHNGIIENYMEIKEELEGKGYIFLSETDTEVMAHLIESYYEGDLVKACRTAINRVDGSYALVVMSKVEPDRIVVMKKDNPIIIGLGVGENFIASDIPAVIDYTRNIYILDEKEMAIVTKNHVEIADYQGNPITKDIFKVTWDVASAQKDGFDHFMLKEIYEQPKAIRDTIRGRLDLEGMRVRLDDITITKEYLEGISRIYIVACGTAYHAGLYGKMLIEKLARVPVEVDVASEFRYRNPIIDDKTLFIAVSQSGETLDTMAALSEAKSKGARILSITNVVGSAVARHSDDVLYTWAGPEIAVASTKAYTTQLVAFALLAMRLARTLGRMSDESFRELSSALLDLSGDIDLLIKEHDPIKEMAKVVAKSDNMFFLGRGADHLVAMEGSLKLKEVSYIHSEAYPSGELKHGPIALITEGLPVVVLASQRHLFEKTVSNIKEVKARGAWVLGIGIKGDTKLEQVSDATIMVTDTIQELVPVIEAVALQLLSYYVAIERDCDVDKPRNLAKSVTVE